MDHIKLELVKIARDLCFNEYTDRRAQLHNKWLVESEHLWRSQRLRLAYPDMPVYPSEADIMTRAEKLYKYINQNPLEPAISESEPEVEPVAVSEPVPEPVPELPTETEVSHAEVSEEPPQEPVNNVIELKSAEGPGINQVPVQPEKPKTSEEKRQDAEAKLLELIKEQSKLQTGLGARTETSTARLIPGILNRLTTIKNNLGPPKEEP